MTGIVKSWTHRNYGFITLTGKPGEVDDVFVHKMDLPDGLPGLLVGSEVSFDLVPSRRGLQAGNVRLLQKREVDSAVLVRGDADASALGRAYRIAEGKSS